MMIFRSKGAKIIKDLCKRGGCIPILFFGVGEGLDAFLQRGDEGRPRDGDG